MRWGRSPGRRTTSDTVLEAVEELDVDIAAEELFAFLDKDSPDPGDGVRVVQRWVLTGAADRHDELQVELLGLPGRRPWLSAVVVEEVDPPRLARWRGLGEQDVTMRLELEPTGPAATHARMITRVALPAGTPASVVRGTRAWLDDPTYLEEAAARLRRTMPRRAADPAAAYDVPPVALVRLAPVEHRVQVPLDADGVWDVLGDLAAVPTPHGPPQRVMSLVGARDRPRMDDLAAAAVSDPAGRRQVIALWVDRVDPGTRLITTSASETFEHTVDLLLEAHRSGDGTDSTVVRVTSRLRVLDGLDPVEVQALADLVDQRLVEHLADLETRLGSKPTA